MANAPSAHERSLVTVNELMFITIKKRRKAMPKVSITAGHRDCS
jgi:hypothetical protein